MKKLKIHDKLIRQIFTEVLTNTIPKKISFDIALEGWGISNKESLNMGDCPNKP